MIITLNIQSENIYFKIFKVVNIAFNKLGINIRKTKGRPSKYLCCMYAIWCK
ncbi:hypothetical protein [Clostridium haemolyticum]|uniref:hypothetical protein n=1 Tax=Clostridium haemolyticum TaxID=84025 RepID=UPI001FA8D392|nr:hypothetical protein [Clostridium haemolyticum]